MGVPYSYYHDKNGVYHAYAQPEERDAPIQVVRREGDVYIDAYIEFTGNTNQKLPGTNYSYAEIAYMGIMDNWNTGLSYNISGKDANGNYLGDDNVQLHVNLFSSNESSNGIIQNPTDKKHKTVKIGITNDFIGSLPVKLGFTSHVLTESPLEASWNPIERLKIAYNIGHAISSGQKEQAFYNWRISNPGEMTLYGPDSQLGYSKTAAHEFGHMLGLGDAYSAFYRDNKSSPSDYTDMNQYGQMAKYTVPDTDMMRSNEILGNQETLTENDVRMLIKAWMTGKPQYFKK